MAKKKIAERRQLAEGEASVVYLEDGRQVALFHLDGQFYAMDNSCPHRGGPLGEGEIEGGLVACPWHGWQFDIKTGQCQTMPGECAKKLKIEVDETSVYLIE